MLPSRHFALLLSPFAFSTFTVAADCSNSSTVRTVFQYPKVGHWLGNLAIRANGSILTTDLLTPFVFEFNPFITPSQPQPIGPFPNSTGLTGIAETAPDNFAVIGGNFKNESSEARPGSLRLYNVVTKPKSAPTVHLTAPLLDIPLLNGLMTLTPSTVLGSDSSTGAVWSIDVQSGAHKKVIQDPLMSSSQPSSPNSSKLGINGLKIRREDGTSFLYFTNTARGILAKIAINPTTGTPLTPNTKATLVAKNAGAAKGVGFDDFAFGPDMGSNIAFATNSRGNSIAKVALDGSSQQNIVAGNLNSTEVAEPSAVEFGRTMSDKGVLYVVTAGGAGGPINGTTRVGAQLLAIDTQNVDCGVGNGTDNGMGVGGQNQSSSGGTFMGGASSVDFAPSLVMLVASVILGLYL
ncbi:hypothetical protein ACLMJK_003793 [Lecanora helva]